MRNTVILIGLLLLVLTGCTYEGTITVNNDTSNDCWVSILGDVYEVEANDSVSKDYTSSKGLFSPKPETTIRWDGYCVFEQVSVRATKDGDITKTILPDCGAIEVQNNYDCSITELYMRANGVVGWGDNLLESPLESGEIIYWSLEPGEYQVFRFFADETYDISFVLDVDLNTTATVY